MVSLLSTPFNFLLFSSNDLSFAKEWKPFPIILTTKAKSESNRKAIMKRDSSQLEKKPISWIYVFPWWLIAEKEVRKYANFYDTVKKGKNFRW